MKNLHLQALICLYDFLIGVRIIILKGRKMIKNIRFRYNKHSLGMLYMMVIFGVAIGFLIYYAILMVSGIAVEPEHTSTYFIEHPEHAIYLIFGLFPVAILLPAWIAAKCWGSRDEEGQLILYENHAIVRIKNRELRIEKGTLRVYIPIPNPGWYRPYILKVPGHKMVLSRSLKEEKEKRGSLLSLDVAMGELSVYRK